MHTFLEKTGGLGVIVAVIAIIKRRGIETYLSNTVEDKNSVKKRGNKK